MRLSRPALLLTAFLATGYHAITHSASPPTGYTGAPGERNCARCHSGTAVNGSGGQVQLLGLPPAGFKPDSTYHLSVSLTDGRPARNGFELKAATAARVSVGTLTPVTSNTSLHTSGTTTYLGHNGSSATHQWAFNWTAPADTTALDSLIFYVAAVAGNNNGSDTGDHVYTAAVTFRPHAIPIPTASPTLLPQSRPLSLSPNPTASHVHIEAGSPPTGQQRQLAIYDPTGHLLQIIPFTGPTYDLDTTPLPNGTYLVKVTTGRTTSVQRLLVAH